MYARVCVYTNNRLHCLLYLRKFYEHWQVLDNNSTIAIVDFPIEDFFSVPFTHHIRILEKTKDLPECYYYLHRVAQEHVLCTVYANTLHLKMYDY